MEERQITLDGETYPMKEPFLVLATQNPIEQEGTYRLPEAQLDRFLFKISIEYPDASEEVDILKSHHTRGDKKPLDEISKVLTQEEILSYRSQISQIHVEETLMEYITSIIRKTRKDPTIYLGASPRE